MSKLFTGIAFFWEVAKIVFVSLLVVMPIRYFVFQPFIVKGASMSPNFEQNDYLIIDELSYRLHAPQRGDVIVFRFPLDPRQHYIKRIIGLPGETIKLESGKVLIADKDGKNFVLEENLYLRDDFTAGSGEIHLAKNEYFVLGDNRNVSSDSRRWGAVPMRFVTGKVWFRVWPFSSLGTISLPSYTMEALRAPN